MYWLGSPPWGRWILATLIVAAGFWSELRPTGTVDHPFATSPISVGESISGQNTTARPVPAGMLQPIDEGAVSMTNIAAGDPVLASDVAGSQPLVPAGWWIVEMDLPDHVRTGDYVKVVLLETAEETDGVVTAPSSDETFGSGAGAVALPPETASRYAAAAMVGDVAVMALARRTGTVGG